MQRWAELGSCGGMSDVNCCQVQVTEGGGGPCGTAVVGGPGNLRASLRTLSGGRKWQGATPAVMRAICRGSITAKTRWALNITKLSIWAAWVAFSCNTAGARSVQWGEGAGMRFRWHSQKSQGGLVLHREISGGGGGAAFARD